MKKKDYLKETIIDFILKHPNYTSQAIANIFKVKKMRVAAYKAHITMGTYSK